MVDINEEELKGLEKVLKKLEPEIDLASLEVRYLSRIKKRVDSFGRFATSKGIYEFAVSYEDNGKITRSHINLISPMSIRKDVERKVYDERE